MEGRKKRKVDHECRLFKEDWGVGYFFVQSSAKALCIICNETVAVLKEYNLKRHYETKHITDYAQFKGLQRSEKFEKMKDQLFSQQSLFTKASNVNASVTKASYKISYILAKSGKPFTDGDMVKQCLLAASEEICPDKITLFKNVSVAANTVARRIEDIGSNIINQIVEQSKQFQCYSMCMDESTDVCDTSQLLVFIRGVDSDFNVTQELASLHSMHGTTTGEDIFKEVKKTLTDYNLELEQLSCLTIDGGKNMSGIRKGLVGQIIQACEQEEIAKPMFVHCIIHQQALCAKYVDMTCVLKPVVSIVNSIRARGLGHRQFQEFLKETDTEYVDLPYYTAVRWLSCGKVLSRVFHLRKEISQFLQEHDKPQDLLSDIEWLWKLAFFADLTGHMNVLNLKLQGQSNLICELYTHIKAFRTKLVLFKNHVRIANLSHFECCQKLKGETEIEFPGAFAQDVIADLQKQFQERFADLDKKADDIRLFQNPFECDVERISSQYQMEVIDMQSSDTLKDKFKEGNLIQFYKSLLSEQFPQLKQLAYGMVSMFGTTYLCEQTFSKMKYVKNNYRARLSDEHLKSLLMIGSSNLAPQFDIIMKSKGQFHHSH